MPEVISHAQDQAGKVLWNYRNTKGKLNSVRQVYREKLYALSQKLGELQENIDYLLSALKSEAESKVPATQGMSVLEILSSTNTQVSAAIEPWAAEIERRKLDVDRVLTEITAYQRLHKKLEDAEKVLDKNYEANVEAFSQILPMPSIDEVKAEIKQEDYIPKSEGQNLTLSVTSVSPLPENMFKDDIEDAITADVIDAEARTDEIVAQVAAQTSDSAKNGISTKPSFAWFLFAAVAYYLMS